MANIITSTRILFAIVCFFATPFSSAFWISYCCGGISDILDGFIARKLKIQSVQGAKFDSFADVFFMISLTAVVIYNINFPIWLWICIICISSLKIIGYTIGFYKFHTFTTIHTYANKGTGLCIFISPIMYHMFGLTFTGICLCMIALVSSLEEFTIIIKSKELNRDCQSIFNR